MRGANQAQAIAQVNRVFQDKPGCLMVDYIGIAPRFKEALATYTAAHGKGRPPSTRWSGSSACSKTRSRLAFESTR